MTLYTHNTILSGELDSPDPKRFVILRNMKGGRHGTSNPTGQDVIVDLGSDPVPSIGDTFRLTSDGVQDRKLYIVEDVIRHFDPGRYPQHRFWLAFVRVYDGSPSSQAGPGAT